MTSLGQKPSENNGELKKKQLTKAVLEGIIIDYFKEIDDLTKNKEASFLFLSRIKRAEDEILLFIKNLRNEIIDKITLGTVCDSINNHFENLNRLHKGDQRFAKRLERMKELMAEARNGIVNIFSVPTSQAEISATAREHISLSNGNSSDQRGQNNQYSDSAKSSVVTNGGKESSQDKISHKKILTKTELIDFFEGHRKKIYALAVRNASGKLQNAFNSIADEVLRMIRGINNCNNHRITPEEHRRICKQITNLYRGLEKEFNSDHSSLGKINSIKRQINVARATFKESYTISEPQKIVAVAVDKTPSQEWDAVRDDKTPTENWDVVIDDKTPIQELDIVKDDKTPTQEKPQIKEEKAPAVVPKLNNEKFIWAMNSAGVSTDKIPDRLAEVCSSMSIDMAKYFFGPLSEDKSLNPENCFSKDDIKAAKNIFEDFAQYVSRIVKKLSANKKLSYSEFCNEFALCLRRYRFKEPAGKKAEIYTDYFRKGIIKCITDFITDLSNPKDLLDLYQPNVPISLEYVQSCILPNKYKLYTEGRCEELPVSKSEKDTIKGGFGKFNKDPKLRDLRQKIYHLTAEINNIYHAGIPLRSAEGILKILKEEGLVGHEETLEIKINTEKSDAKEPGAVIEEAEPLPAVIRDAERDGTEKLSEEEEEEEEEEENEADGLDISGEEIAETMMADGPIKDETIEHPEDEDLISSDKTKVYGDYEGTEDVEVENVDLSGRLQVRDAEALSLTMSSKLTERIQGLSESELERMTQSSIQLLINLADLAHQHHIFLNPDTQQLSDRLENLKLQLEDKVGQIQTAVHVLEQKRSNIVYLLMSKKDNFSDEDRVKMEDYIRSKENLDHEIYSVDTEQLKLELLNIDGSLKLFRDDIIEAREFLGMQGNLAKIFKGLQLQDFLRDEHAYLVNQENTRLTHQRLFELSEISDEILSLTKNINDLRAEHCSHNSRFALTYKEAKEKLASLGFFAENPPAIKQSEVADNPPVPVNSEVFNPFEPVKIMINGKEVQMKRISADALQILRCLQKINDEQGKANFHFTRDIQRLLYLMKMIWGEYKEFYADETAKMIEDDFASLSEGDTSTPNPKISHRDFELSQQPFIQYAIGAVSSSYFPSCKYKFAITLKGMRIIRDNPHLRETTNEEQNKISEELNRSKLEREAGKQKRKMKQSK